MTNKSLIPWNAESPQIGKIKMEVMMCSKMASASSVSQVIKPHPPLIRFPDGRDDPTANAQKFGGEQGYCLVPLQFHSVLREVNH